MAPRQFKYVEIERKVLSWSYEKDIMTRYKKQEVQYDSADDLKAVGKSTNMRESQYTEYLKRILPMSKEEVMNDSMSEEQSMRKHHLLAKREYENHHDYQEYDEYEGDDNMFAYYDKYGDYLYDAAMEDLMNARERFRKMYY